jgi:hypothetical protein
MAKHQGKSSLWLVIGLAVVGGLIFWWPKPEPVPIQVMTEASPSPEPILSAISADGDVTLKMKQTKEADTITWILTAGQAEEAAKTIWWQVLPYDTTMSIPFNTVSPDNKYLFLKQTGPDKTGYLVLTVSGEPIMPETQTIEFAELFESEHPEYVITEVTGWGGIDLIVFNTDKIEGGIGPSFWFDVASKSFILLSNRFE